MHSNAPQLPPYDPFAAGASNYAPQQGMLSGFHQPQPPQVHPSGGFGEPEASTLSEAHQTQQQPPVLTGVAGMEIINEMFQRQARRLETQMQHQADDRKAVEYTQAQLLVMQAQLQWHAARYQERTEQVTKSSETIARMQSYVATMENERARSVRAARELANDVSTLRDEMSQKQPQRLATLSTSLSEMAGADLSTLEGIGTLFQLYNAAAADGQAAMQGQPLQTADVAHNLASRVAQGPLPGPLGAAPLRPYGDASTSPSLHDSHMGGGGGGSSSAASAARLGSSDSNNEANSFDNSSSDSADAASAASTWPKAIAAKRSGSASRNGNARDHCEKGKSRADRADDRMDGGGGDGGGDRGGDIASSGSHRRGQGSCA